MNTPDRDEVRDLVRVAIDGAPTPHSWTEVQRRADADDAGSGQRRTAIRIVSAAAVILLVVGFVALSDVGRDSSNVPATIPPASSPSTPPTSAATTEPTEPIDATRTASQIAQAYFEAIAASDLDAARALIDPAVTNEEDVKPAGRASTLAGLFDWYDAVGWEWEGGECTDFDDGAADCEMVVRTDWSDAVAIAPLSTSYRVETTDDGITRLRFSVFGRDCCPGFDEFYSWVNETYPDDAAVMWESQSMESDPEILRLFEINTARFVAAQQAVVSPLLGLRSRLTDGAGDELFRVEADEPAYWRLVSLPAYDGDTFGPPLRPLGRDVRPGDDRGRSVTHQVEIASLGGRSVPAAGVPFSATGTSGDRPIEVRVDDDTGSLLASGDLEAGDRFTIEAAVPPFDPDQLRAATTADPPDATIFTELPDDITATVSELAAAVTADTTTSYDAVVALQNWFRTEFEYRLDVDPGHSADALEAFIGDRIGYSEQFAVSFAVMARTLGIPSQVAVGFTPGVRDGNGTYRVTGADAHAWPEIWFDGIGWVPFEPTPGRRAPGIHTGT